MLKIFCLIFSLFIFLPVVSQGASLNIIINEIAWMGTKVSYSDEWIELYNSSNYSVNLEGWKSEAEDKSPKIDLKGKIPSKGFFLLERTSDETVLDIKADLIYKGGLNNEGEYLKLINSQGKIIDEINCSSKWFNGNNKTKRTMERISFSKPGNNFENWQTSQDSGGTPKAKNSSGFAKLELPRAESEGGSIRTKTAFINEKSPEAYLRLA